MKKLVVILGCLAIASSAFAVADPDPDGIGVWFDLTADTNHVDVASGMIPIYLIISNSTCASVGGWECTLEWNQAMAFVAGSWAYEGTHLNVYTEPQFAVGLAVPIPTSDATLLVSCNLFLVDPVGTVISVLPAPAPSTPDNLPLYVDGEDLNHLVLLQNASGYGAEGEILPCASINQGPITATENATWSQVKSLW